MEQPLGNPSVWPCETDTHRRVEAAVPLEIDGDSLHIEELTDTLDGRLERVGERQLRDGFCHDSQKCTRPSELRSRPERLPGRAQRLRRPDAERPKLGEIAFGGHRAVREQELENADGRLSERQRDRHVCAAREALDRLDGHRLVRSPRSLHGVARVEESRVRSAQTRGGDQSRWLCVVAEPEETRGGAGRAAREPSELRTGLVMLGCGRERITCKLERRAVFAPRLRCPKATEDEPRLCCRESRDGAIACVEAARAAEELDTSIRAVVGTNRKL